MLAPALAAGLALLAAGAAEHPVLPIKLSPAALPGLRQAVAPLLKLTEPELLRLVPERSGLYFVGCPNCTGGRQEGQFAFRSDQRYVPWDPARPDVLRCSYCGHEYPSAKYPMAGVLKVHNPRGELQEYRYWTRADGYRYYFEARLDEHRLRYAERMCNLLARTYALSGEAAYAHACALLLDRFAQVYPGYCFHYDYPFQPKVIEDGPVDPKAFRPGFRTARWSWWAYMDVPQPLVEAYDLIAASGELERLSTAAGRDVPAGVIACLETAVRQVMANVDDLTNMSPGMWTTVIHAGRVLGHPEWVHAMVGRLERFIDAGFFTDGAWSEGAPSYNAQVLGNLVGVFGICRGYSDPPGWRDPVSGERFDDLDVERAVPAVARARQAYARLRLPDGRLLPLHDTWSTQTGGPPAPPEPLLLPGLGLGVLAGGADAAAWQAALTWSPGLGHQHFDGLSLLLYAHGRELLSDLGYTHSRDRAWTLPTVAHNTVVIDGRNQEADAGTLGNLRYYDASDPGCQLVSVDNPQVYPGLATTYRRTLVAVAPTEAAPGYLVDLFEVAGGARHDWLLHGCADTPGSVTASAAGAELPSTPLATLLPAGLAFTEAANEGDGGKVRTPYYAYGYLRDLRQVIAPPTVVSLAFGLEGAGAALRAHLPPAPGDVLVLGRNPAVRGAHEDDDQLRSHWRPFALWRHEGGASVFAAVLEPLGPAVGALTVRRLDLPGAVAAIEVEAGPRRDLVLLRPQGLRGAWQGRPLAATAELVVLLGEIATVAGGEAAWGGQTLKTIAVAPAELLAADRRAGTLRVRGECLPPAGTVVTVDHGGARTSAYTVARAERVGEDSLLTVAEDPGFDWDPATQTAKFRCRPGTTYTGQHTVRWLPVARR